MRALVDENESGCFQLPQGLVTPFLSERSILAPFLRQPSLSHEYEHHDQREDEESGECGEYGAEAAGLVRNRSHFVDNEGADQGFGKSDKAHHSRDAAARDILFERLLIGQPGAESECIKAEQRDAGFDGGCGGEPQPAHHKYIGNQ